MKTRIIVGVTLLIAVLGLGTYASRAGEVAGRSQWTLVNLREPLQVKDQIVMGPVLIVHDDAKMARGLPCTTFFRFDPATGPKEELVSFHCKPMPRAVADQTTFNVVNTGGCKRMTDYQIAGDPEAHGIPVK
jgi:hypothetical protein